MRMAIELSGCLRSLNTTMPYKLAAVMEARAAGLHVDLFCALEACNNVELEMGRAGVVDEFSSRFREAAGRAAINCTWWPYTEGMMKTTDEPRESVRAQLPGYPYHYKLGVRKMNNILAQAYKFQVVGDMRRRTGHYYHFVWRQRPDFVSTGLNFSDQAIASIGGRPGANPAAHYMLPSICAQWAHTDIEALLSADAADHYDAQFSHVPSLPLNDIKGPSLPGPERSISLHMYNHGWQHVLQKQWQLFRCNAGCFGADAPCRLLTGGDLRERANCTIEQNDWRLCSAQLQKGRAASGEAQPSRFPDHCF